MRRRTWLVFSHAPPLGCGDTPTDPYHVGFRSYRLLLERLSPPLWLHGHTACSDRSDRTVSTAQTLLVNVTGSYLIELCPPSD
jgi:Icc-related predicted phosphoesterase